MVPLFIKYFPKTVDIGEGVTDQILIHSNDDPRDLAIKFSSRHNLPGKILLRLVDSIVENKDLAEEKFK
jgi:hypothetical protein